MTTPTLPVHPVSATSTVTSTSTPISAPALDLLGEHDLVRKPGPDAQGDLAPRRRVLGQVAHGAAQRREADAADDDHDVDSLEALESPVGAERAADPDDGRPPPRTASAWLTAPTSRTVCSIGTGAPGAELIEMATSPTPKAVSMLNCPALNGVDRLVDRLEPQGRDVRASRSCGRRPGRGTARRVPATCWPRLSHQGCARRGRGAGRGSPASRLRSTPLMRCNNA